MRTAKNLWFALAAGLFAAQGFCSSTSLDGDWRFKYFDSAASYAANEGEWHTIALPSNWEMHGFGKFSYGSEKARNVSEESGLYMTKFRTPDDFASDMVAFLRFEGVMFGAEVAINGKKAGSFRSSFNRNTLDVTGLLKPAGEENELAVHTLIQPKGALFDTNDDWTLHGIFRSVFLDVRPAVHLVDWSVRVNVAGDHATVDIKAEVSGDGTVEVDYPRVVAKDELWSAENPVLHEIVFKVKDSHGNITETVKEKIGLREISWDCKELKVNGRRVWLKGVNHHDLCPCHGRAITAAEQWRDVKMIKEAGMNFIRCSHYPPSTALLDACDYYGVYVMDEVPFGFGDHLLYEAGNEEVLRERVRLTLDRDKTRASVLVWSVGNENPVTPISIAAGRMVGELDPTRPWTFPMIPGVFRKWISGENPLAAENTDIPLIYDWHYPNAMTIAEVLASNRLDRAVIASEWGHAFGSETGELDEDYAAMKSWNEFHGGAIWMFQDQGIERKIRDASEKERLESCWKDETTLWDSHGIAGSDGLVYSDRTPQTGWYQILALFNGEKRCREGLKFGGLDASSAFATSLPTSELPSFQLRFDRRMTITKRNTMASGEASRKKRDAALAKGKKWTPGRRDAAVKDLVLPRIQNANEGDIVCVETNGVYLVSYSISREEAWDSSEAGICFEMPQEASEFRWLGRGPYEMYPRREALDGFGVWHLNKGDLYFPGNRSGVTAAIVSGKTGAGWLVLPAKEGESLNIAVENTAGGAIRFCVNQFVCGIYHKRSWPDDMRHIEAGEKIEGAFKMIPVSSDWPEAVREVFGASDATKEPFMPFLRNYDAAED